MNPRSRARQHGWFALQLATVIALALLSSAASATAAEFDFDAELDRIDTALQENPMRVSAHALDSCAGRRRFAIRLYNSGLHERAARALKSCQTLLHLPESAEAAPVSEPQRPSMEAIQQLAALELEAALKLEPDVAAGLAIYRECAACHMPEGWGLRNGSVPQLAGQHRSVVIKQLADIRAGNRDAWLMLPYASVDAIGGVQAVANVAGYIDTLEISTATGKGPGDDLELGEQLYRDNCARCHGATGEGDAAAYVPRIQAQHYNYLVRQFEWIRDGKRRNANPEMVEQIAGFDVRQVQAVLDYVSRLEPPEELVAPEGWKNPDFAD